MWTGRGREEANTVNARAMSSGISSTDRTVALNAVSGAVTAAQYPEGGEGRITELP